MAVATKTKPQGKTAFIKEVLFDNPLANSRAINEAWKAAGMEGTISDSLVNVQRAELGLTGNLRKQSMPATGGPAAKSKAKKVAPATKVKAKPAAVRSTTSSGQKPKSNARDRVLSELEAELDRWIYRLIGVGGLLDLEDALRTVRRQVIQSHKA